LILFPCLVFAGRVRFVVFPDTVSITITNEEFTNRTFKAGQEYVLPDGNYTAIIENEGYYPKAIDFVSGRRRVTVEEKLEKRYDGLRLVKEVKTASQPKSVVFLDETRFLVNHLNDTYLEIHSINSTNLITLKVPENFARAKGFVEGLVDWEQNEIFVSQMTRNCVHIFDATTGEYKTNMSAKGVWTKVIAKNCKYLFFSNWTSEDVAIFDRFTKEFVGKVKTAGIPRGMSATPDGKYLYVAVFSDSIVQKIDLENMKVEKTFRLSPRKGAARHIVMDEARGFIYVSDMGRAEVFKVDMRTDEVVGSVKVYSKPNTIAISPDGRTVFVSSRAPNGNQGYLYKSATFGQVQVIDTDAMEVTGWVWGRNQTTGLGISPDGKFLAASDFLDANVGVYRIFAGLIRAVYDDNPPERIR